MLKDVRESGTWEINGYIVRSPAYQIWLNGNNKILSEETESASTNENWGFQDKVKLSPDQATDLFSFLIAQEKLLDHITNYYDQDAREALKKMYRLIAAYGRKIREGRQDTKFLETTKKTVIPTTLPKGSYFTVTHTSRAGLRRHIKADQSMDSPKQT